MMVRQTNPCNKDCSQTFAEQFQELLADVCFLANVSGTTPDLFDRRVAVSISDPSPSTLDSKLEGTSGIYFFVDYGVSGQTYKAALDLQFLDDRYSNQTQNVLNLGLNSGTHNGHVIPSRCLDGGIQSLVYPSEVRGSSSWNQIIPKDFYPGQTELNIKWVETNSVSGVTVFKIEYNSIGTGEIISLPYEDYVTGIADGIDGKVHTESIEIVSGIIIAQDIVTLKLTRMGDSISDTLDAPVNIVGISLVYDEF